MRILVTGGAGFLGSHVVTALRVRDRDARLAVLDDLSLGRRENVPPKIPLYCVDVRNWDALLIAMRDFRPDQVIHLAAQTSVKRSIEDPLLDADVNVLGGVNVLKAAEASGVRRLVFASTGGAMYGDVPDGQLANETWPVRARCQYARSKAQMESYLNIERQCFGVSSAALRFGNIFGPRQDPRGEAGVVAIFAQKLLDDQAVTLYARRRAGDGGCARDYLYVDDAVSAVLNAVDDQLEGVYNVGAGKARSTQQVLQAVAREVGRTPVVIEAPPREGDVEAVTLDASRLRQTGWRPRHDFQTAIALTVAWFRRAQAETVEARPLSPSLHANPPPLGL
jgi:UDP-glucose 4-epimerase